MDIKSVESNSENESSEVSILNELTGQKFSYGEEQVGPYISLLFIGDNTVRIDTYNLVNDSDVMLDSTPHVEAIGSNLYFPLRLSRYSKEIRVLGHIEDETILLSNLYDSKQEWKLTRCIEKKLDPSRIT